MSNPTDKGKARAQPPHPQPHPHPHPQIQPLPARIASSATSLISGLVGLSDSGATFSSSHRPSGMAASYTSDLASMSSSSKLPSFGGRSGGGTVGGTWAESSSRREKDDLGRMEGRMGEEVDVQGEMREWDGRYEEPGLDYTGALHQQQRYQQAFAHGSTTSNDIAHAQSQDGADVLQLLSISSDDQMHEDLQSQFAQIISAGDDAMPTDEITEDPVEWLMTSGTGGGYTQQVWGTGAWAGQMREQFDDEPETPKEEEEEEVVQDEVVEAKEEEKGKGKVLLRSRM